MRRGLSGFRENKPRKKGSRKDRKEIKISRYARNDIPAALRSLREIILNFKRSNMREKIISRSFFYVHLVMLAIVLSATLSGAETQGTKLFDAGQGVKMFSPIIGADGNLYVRTGNNYLYAVYADGTGRKWALGKEISVSSDPAAGSDGTVYAASSDKRLLAVNPDASQKWKTSTDISISLAPAIGDEGIVYAAAEDNHLYAFNPDNGSQKWRYPESGELRLVTPPVVGPGGVVYIGSNDGYLYAVNSDGTLKWKSGTEINPTLSPAIAADGTIYVVSEDDALCAVNSNGTEKWRSSASIENLKPASSPVVDKDGTIYVGSEDGYVYALSSGGSEKAKYKTEARVSSTPALTQGGFLCFGSEDGYFYMVNLAETDADKQITTYQTDGKLSASPAVGSDGTIYIGSENGILWAIKGSSKTGLKTDAPWPMFRHDARHTARNTPIADAGSEQTVNDGDTVTLNGSGSSDPLGIKSYKWTQTEGTSVTLSDSSSSKPTFTAPALGTDGEEVKLTFRLTVTNQADMEDADTCVITVEETDANCFIGVAAD